jgi:hypothetical protein
MLSEYVLHMCINDTLGIKCMFGNEFKVITCFSLLPPSHSLLSQYAVIGALEIARRFAGPHADTNEVNLLSVILKWTREYVCERLAVWGGMSESLLVEAMRVARYTGASGLLLATFKDRATAVNALACNAAEVMMVWDEAGAGGGGGGGREGEEEGRDLHEGDGSVGGGDAGGVGLVGEGTGDDAREEKGTGGDDGNGSHGGLRVGGDGDGISLRVATFACDGDDGDVGNETLNQPAEQQEEKAQVDTNPQAVAQAVAVKMWQFAETQLDIVEVSIRPACMHVWHHWYSGTCGMYIH